MLRSVFAKTLWEQRRCPCSLGRSASRPSASSTRASPLPSTRRTSRRRWRTSPQSSWRPSGSPRSPLPAGVSRLDETLGILGPHPGDDPCARGLVPGRSPGTRRPAGSTSCSPIRSRELGVVVERYGALMLVAVVLVCLVLFVALVAISGVAQLGDIGASNLLAASIHLAALGAFFGGLALAVGAPTGSRAITSASIAVVSILSYFDVGVADRLHRLGPRPVPVPLLLGWSPIGQRTPDHRPPAPFWGGSRPRSGRCTGLQPARRRGVGSRPLQDGRVRFGGASGGHSIEGPVHSTGGGARHAGSAHQAGAANNGKRTHRPHRLCRVRRHPRPSGRARLAQMA